MVVSDALGDMTADRPILLMNVGIIITPMHYMFSYQDMQWIDIYRAQKEVSYVDIKSCCFCTMQLTSALELPK